MHSLSFKTVVTGSDASLLHLMKLYGTYMYTQLQLTDGKERFDKELEHFPIKKYTPPEGQFIIAYLQIDPIGCVGITRWDKESCEMKRLFIKEEFRGHGFGKELVLEIIRRAKWLNYTRILLDTNAEMKEAVSLYRKLNFRNISPYCFNENPNPVYLGYDID
jgi:carbonic anhydrase